MTPRARFSIDLREENDVVIASTTGDVVTALATVLVAVITVVGGYFTQRAIARQTLDEQRPRRSTVGRQKQPREASVQPPARSREVEGYVVRFILFYLFLQAWTAILNVTNPFLLFSGRLVGIAVGLVYALIFLLLGMPLLLDILRRYGIRASRLMHHSE